MQENQHEVNSTKEQDDTHPETEQTKMDIPSILKVQSIEQALDDTSIPNVQSVEHVEANIPGEGRVENNVGVGEAIKIDKVEIPLKTKKGISCRRKCGEDRGQGLSRN